MADKSSTMAQSRLSSSTVSRKTTQGRNGTTSRGVGRPAVATEFWQSSTLRRKLLRLYLCSDIDLNDVFPLMSTLIPATPKFSKRSVQLVVHELLNEGTKRIPNYRPGRTEMRARVRCLRQIRSQQKKAIRARLQRPQLLPAKSGADPAEIHAISCEDQRPVPMAMVPTKPPDFTSHPRSSGESASLTLERPVWHSSNHGSKDRQSIRLSWIVSKLQGKNEDRPTSWYSDIRSLLNLSIRSSLLSSNGSSVLGSSVEEQGQPESDNNDPDARRNAELIKSCCGVSNDCFHRKIRAAIQTNGRVLDVNWSDLQASDIFGDTVMHVAARWGASFELLERLLSLSSIVSTTNLRGETFVHVMKLQLRSLNSGINEFFYKLHSLAFRFDARDASGHTIFTAILARAKDGDQSLDAIRERLYGLDRLIQAPSFVSIIFGKRYTEVPDYVAIYDFLTQLPGFLNLEEANLIATTAPTPPLNIASQTPDLDIDDNNKTNRTWAVSDCWSSKLDVDRAQTSDIYWVRQLKLVVDSYLSNDEAAANAHGLKGRGNMDSPESRTVYYKYLVQVKWVFGIEPYSNYTSHGNTFLMSVIIDMAGGRVTKSLGQKIIHAIASARTHSKRKVANLLQQDAKGNTALHLAVQLGVDSAVSTLVKLGAPLNCVNDEGKTPFQIATARYVQSKSEDRLAIFTARRLKTIVHLLESKSQSNGNALVPSIGKVQHTPVQAHLESEDDPPI